MTFQCHVTVIGVSKWTEDTAAINQSDEDNISSCSFDDLCHENSESVGSSAKPPTDSLLLPIMTQQKSDSELVTSTSHRFPAKQRKLMYEIKNIGFI